MTVAVAHALAATFEPWPEATVIDTSGARPDSFASASAAVVGPAGRRGDH